MARLRFRQIHLDFHTSEQIVGVGEDFDPKEFATTLHKAGVNSVTCFARCHHGMIYYDTRFPAKHPSLQRDLLREQIEACHALDIKVPIYITVGLDEYVATNHPEWWERTPEGQPYGAGPLQAGWRKLCLNTAYVDYVAEQTIEVMETFASDLDGLFFDIIFQNPCCCAACMAGMAMECFDPTIEADRRAYADQVVNRFKQRITRLVRQYDKTCTVFYNAGHVGPGIRNSLATYTHLELESLPSGGWGYEHFPTTVRFAKLLGQEYLGMTGKFHKSWADFGGFKDQPALEYECFLSLANGAKISVGDQLHPTGKINQATYQLIGPVFQQVKDKEAWCDHVVPVSDIAVFTPEALEGGHIRVHPAISGVYRMLIEADHQFDIVDEHIDWHRYKVLILPDVITLDDHLQQKVAAYLHGGGKVIASHRSGMNPEGTQFALAEFGVDYVGAAAYSPDYVVASESLQEGLLPTEYVLYDAGYWVKPVAGTQVLAQLWNPYFNRTYQHFCSHRQTPVEKASDYPAITKHGDVVYITHPIFSMYHRHGMSAYKQLVLNSLELLLPDKLVRSNAPTTAQMNLNYQTTHDRHVLHILHYIPERRSAEVDVIQDVIPLYDIELQVRLPHKPKRVYCAPSEQEVAFTYENGCVHLTVPEVVGHQMVVFA